MSDALLQAQRALAAGEPDIARAALDMILEGDPGNAGAHLCLASLLMEEGHYDDAAGELLKVLAASPAHRGALAMLSAVEQARERPNHAILALHRALDQNPSDAALHDALGNIYYRMGIFFEAMSEFQLAANLDSSYADSFDHLEPEYFSTGRYEEALERFEKARKERRDVAKAHASAGRLFADLGFHHAATAAFRRALEVDPLHVEACQRLGEASAATGRYEEADAAFDKLSKMRPRVAAVRARLGAVRERRRLHEGALEQYREAAALAPAYGAAHFVLARKLDSAERRAEALAAYVRHARLKDDGPFAGDAIERIAQLAGTEYRADWEMSQLPPVASEAPPLTEGWAPAEAEIAAAKVLWSVLSDRGESDDLFPADEPVAPSETAFPSDRPEPPPVAVEEEAGSRPTLRIVRPGGKPVVPGTQGAASPEPSHVEAAPSGGSGLKISHGDGSVMAGGRKVGSGLAAPQRSEEPADAEAENGESSEEGAAEGGDKRLRPIRKQAPPPREGDADAPSGFKIVRNPTAIPGGGESPVSTPESDKGFKIVRKFTYFAPKKDGEKGDS